MCRISMCKPTSTRVTLLHKGAVPVQLPGNASAQMLPALSSLTRRALLAYRATPRTCCAQSNTWTGVVRPCCGSRMQPYNTLLPRRRSWTVVRFRPVDVRSTWVLRALAPKLWKVTHQRFHSQVGHRSWPDTTGDGSARCWATDPASSQRHSVAVLPPKMGARTCLS